MVFDTEMYARKLASRNTGGQASKASNIGEVCQFAAAGKEMGKKSLSEIAMSYGYVYVGQIALGANPAQALKVIQEAEAYNMKARKLFYYSATWMLRCLKKTEKPATS